MALRSQKVSIPLAGGLDEEVHDFILQPPSHARLTNLEHTEDGALVRRDELAGLATTSGSVEAMLGFNSGGRESLAVLTKEGARVLSGDIDQGGGALESASGTGPRSMDLRRTPIVRSSEGAAGAWSAAAAGYVCHVWTRGRADDDGAVWVRIDDTATGATIYGPTFVTGMDALALGATGGSPGEQAHNAGIFVVACNETDDGTDRAVTFAVFGHEAQGGATSTSDPVAVRLYRVLNQNVTPGTTTTLAVRCATFNAHADPSTSRLFVAGYDGGSWDLYEYDCSGSAPTLSGSPRLLTVASADRCLAICHGVISDRVHMIFWDASSGSDLLYENVDVATTLSGTSSLNSGTAYTQSGTSPHAAPYTAGICENASGFVVVFQGDQDNTTRSPATDQYYGVKAIEAATTGATTSSTGRELWNVKLLAGPFVDDDGNVLVPLSADAEQEFAITSLSDNFARVSRKQAYVAEVDATQLRRICEYGQDVVHEMRWESGTTTNKLGHKRVSHTYRLRAGQGWGWPVMADEVDTVNLDPSLVASAVLNSAAFVTVTPGGQTVRALLVQDRPTFAAGYLAKVDGERVGGVMQMPPPQVTEASVTSAGSSDGMTMRLCWTWRDAGGIVHRSAPSEAVSSPSNEELVDFNVAMPPWSDWDDAGGTLPTDVWLECYTDPIFASGATGDGFFRRLISVGGGDAAEALRLGDIYDSSAPWESLTVTIDRTEAGVLPLYTNGGVLEHDPVPCPVDAVASRDRLWVVNAEDRSQAWFSVPVTSGLVAPAFSALLTLRVRPDAGDIVAVGAIDDLVVFFCRSSTHAVEAIGGPDSTGVGAFPPLRTLSTERGCINPASVVTTDLGVLFQARDGIWAIGGEGAMTPIGRSVRSTLEGRTVRDAVVLSDKQQAVWLLDNDTALVFDMEAGAWSLHDYSPEDSAYTAAGALNGDLVLGTDDGTIWKATSDLPLKGGADIDIGLTTGWIKLAGLQGFKRVRRMGILGRLATGEASFTPDADPPSGHTSDLGELTVSVWYDYDEDSSPDTYTLDMTESSGVGLDPFHWRIPLARQKCAAIKVGIDYDAPKLVGEPIGGTWADYPLRVELVGLALEVGMKRGIRKIGHGAGGTVS